MDSARADKWLWATRFFKTRALAAKACVAGKVERAGLPVKSATSIHEGDVLEIPFPEGPGARVVRVKQLITLRVAAPLAQACYEDLTDPAVYENLKQVLAEKRAAGAGRPTKKDRRSLGKIRGFWD
jgi:ribosome-associated heat shock protein Hsp15